ncbi:MAG: hypothetical protein ACT6QS_07395 [Flavobacteriales bacterium]
MNSNKEQIPQNLKLTVEMFRSAYPQGITPEDYYTCIRIMKDSGMSDRTAAQAIGILKSLDYTEVLYDVAHEMPNRKIEAGEINRVVEKLKPHGYDRWLEED